MQNHQSQVQEQPRIFCSSKVIVCDTFGKGFQALHVPYEDLSSDSVKNAATIKAVSPAGS